LAGARGKRIRHLENPPSSEGPAGAAEQLRIVAIREKMIRLKQLRQRERGRV
jgi:hypothetical protein